MPTQTSLGSTPVNGVTTGAHTFTTGVSAGNVILVHLVVRGNQTSDPAIAGYDILDSINSGTNAANTRQVLYGRIADGSETAVPTVTFAAAQYGHISADKWSGVDVTGLSNGSLTTINLFDTFYSEAQAGSGLLTVSAASFTTGVAGCEVGMYIGAGSGGSGAYATAPATLDTSSGTFTSFRSITGVNRMGAHGAKKTQAAAGAVGTGGATWSVAPGGGLTVQMFALPGTDSTAPTLSLHHANADDSDSATIGASTNEANGTMYAVVTTVSGTPTTAQIKLGQNSLGNGATYAGSQAITTTGAKTFSAAPLVPSTTYYTYIFHEDAAGNQSAIAIPSSFTTTALPVPPDPPTTLTATSRYSRVELNWTDNDDVPDETSFRVERAPDVAGSPGTWAEIDSTAANVVTYDDESAVDGVTYHYRIRALGAEGYSTYSNIVTGHANAFVTWTSHDWTNVAEAPSEVDGGGTFDPTTLELDDEATPDSEEYVYDNTTLGVYWLTWTNDAGIEPPAPVRVEILEEGALSHRQRGRIGHTRMGLGF